MSAADWFDTGVRAARIAVLRAAGPASLAVSWADGARAGRTETVDMTAVIEAYTAYRPLRNNPSLFATAQLIDDGYAVAWNGIDIDMSAETILAVAQKSVAPRSAVAV